MNDYTVKLKIKSKLQQELLSFIEIDEIKNEVFEAFKGENHDEVYEDIWRGYRDEWIDELNDRLVNTLNVIGYHNGLEIALALQYWNFEDATFEIKDAEDLGFNASYDWVTENGVIYDVVDAFLKDEFEVELNK